MASILDFGDKLPVGCLTNFGRVCTHLVLRGHAPELATAWWGILLNKTRKNQPKGDESHDTGLYAYICVLVVALDYYLLGHYPSIPFTYHLFIPLIRPRLIC